MHNKDFQTYTEKYESERFNALYRFRNFFRRHGQELQDKAELEAQVALYELYEKGEQRQKSIYYYIVGKLDMFLIDNIVLSTPFTLSSYQKRSFRHLLKLKPDVADWTEDWILEQHYGGSDFCVERAELMLSLRQFVNGDYGNSCTKLNEGVYETSQGKEDNGYYKVDEDIDKKQLNWVYDLTSLNENEYLMLQEIIKGEHKSFIKMGESFGISQSNSNNVIRSLRKKLLKAGLTKEMLA